MSMWQFFAALNGYLEAHAPKDGARLSEQEAEELFVWIEADNSNSRALSTPVYWWDEAGPQLLKTVRFQG